MITELPKYISKNLISIVCFTIILVLGFIDFITSDYSLILFYIIVVVAATWFINIWYGIAGAVISGVIQAVADYYDHHDEVFQTLYYWNWTSELIVIIIVCL